VQKKLAKKSKNNTFEHILLEAMEEALAGLGENVKAKMSRQQ
jgi:DNA-binding protein YbaB